MNKTKNIIFLFIVICTLVIFIVVLVVEIITLRNQEPKIQFVEVEVTLTQIQMEYYSGLEINKEVQLLIEGGGMQLVLDFFNYYTKDNQVTTAILNESLEQEIPIVTAFSLAWGESRFDARAINNNGGNSTDWGLFQLNDGYRQNWSREDFFDINKNTKEGLSYFSYSMNTFSRKIVISIAGYNKGVENVNRGDSISYFTLAHISNIIEYERKLERELNIFIIKVKNEQ